MTDSPAFQDPLDPREQPILESVLTLRDKLSLLKQDRSTHIKCHDVLTLYDQVIVQVHQLNVLREQNETPLEQNRVDTVLDDCFQLISLFFLTIGRNNEAPAVYSMTSTIKRLLDHLKEAAFYSPKDLESVSQRLDLMQDTLKKDGEKHSPHLLTLLGNRIDTCRNLLSELRSSLADLSPQLTPVYERLVSILRSISAANTRHNFPLSEVQGLRDQLQDIQSAMVDGNFLAEDTTMPTGQQIARELLNRCLKWSEIVISRYGKIGLHRPFSDVLIFNTIRQGKIDERFSGIYDKLCNIRNQLEKLSITQAWSLRETDLYNFQRQLDRIDESRVGGNFEDAQGNKADLHAQRTLLYLIRRSYAYIYTLLISSEPVSEALLPVFNQLQTLRRCLFEVKRSGGVSSIRELYPYSMKLDSMDKMRVNGKFVVGSDIPEGQGSVNTLLDECCKLYEELKIKCKEP
ncbi:MAG: hypothetical protein LQ342_003775 [Letrouitia transgressa]|nr:MAG: hypothetical protein LQ342_003775 [Letrouitia transgressa]